MADDKRSISDLKASELQSEIGLSRSYASELLNGKRRPSLDIAVKIERRFGVPAAAWVDHEAGATA
jgi:antitoxin component HigA of HigAB toxin-antitoxin module